MRICFLAHADSIHTRRWVRHFRDQGHEVTVLSLTPGAAEDGVTTRVLGAQRHIRQEQSNWHYLSALPSLWKEMRAANADVINAHFLSSYGILGALVRPRGIPFVISLHGSDVLVIPRTSLWKAGAARWALRQANLVTSVAEHMTAVVRDELGYRGPIHTRQYGVDTSLFHEPTKVAQRAPVIVSTRRLETVANPTILIDAMRILQAQESPLRMRIVGDGSLRRDLERYAGDLVSQGLVTFTGALPPERVADELQSAGIYTTTTVSDGASLSLLEAMACGAFPIASDIPANREWIQHGVNGLLFEPDSTEMFVKCLVEGWASPSLRRSAASMNHRMIAKRGDARVNLGELEALFVSITKASPS